MRFRHLSLVYFANGLLAEVESLISRNVKSWLSDVKETQVQNIIQASLIQALENSSSWVDMYECAGMLYIPDVGFGGVFPEYEDRVKKVSKWWLCRAHTYLTVTSLSPRVYLVRRVMIGDSLQSRWIYPVWM